MIELLWYGHHEAVVFQGAVKPAPGKSGDVIGLDFLRRAGIDQFSGGNGFGIEISTRFVPGGCSVIGGPADPVTDFAIGA